MGWYRRSRGSARAGQVRISLRVPPRLLFEETLEKIGIISAGRTILTHIEEIFQRSYDDLRDIETQYRDLNITFAYDGLAVEV